MGENIEDWHPGEDYAASYGPWLGKGGGARFCFCHDVDYLYWFLGKPATVQAVGGKMTPLKGDAENMVKALWKYPGGAIASRHIDYWQRPHRCTFQLLGTEGSLFWDNEAKTLTCCPHAKGKDAQTWNIPEGFDHNDTFIAEVSNFINAIEKGSPPAIPLNDGIDVPNLCLQMREQCILSP